MSEIDPNKLDKLKVTELREELKNRGLDTKGNKPVLVKRLKQALNKEQGIADAADESIGEQDTSQEDHDESSQDSGQIQEETSNQGQDFEEAAAPMESEEAEPTGQTEAELLGGGEDDDDQNGEHVEGDELLEDDAQGEEQVEYQTIDETTSQDDQEQEKDEDKEGGRKRKRSRSRSRERRRSRSRERRRSPRRSPPRPKVEMEDDSWEAGENFNLDRYNSDLNLRIDENGVKAHPLSMEGFAFMWAGARSMFGIQNGKVAFEVKLLEDLNVEHLPSDEANPHVLRVGWSTDSTSLQLGEEALSYGFGGTGKASTECKFKDYGETFTQGDVITAYLDMESDPVIISFAKNGNDLGTCYEVEKSTLEEKALFPHILSKNTEFECNFGKKEEPFFALAEGFKFVEEVPAEERIRGTIPPAKKEECEIIMMVGLPGAGKTYWADKHSAANADKKYNILGTNYIIDKMKVMGLPRKKNYAGRWDVLIDKATKCLNRLIEIAARKKRNYILDQTNVYASARRRKMQPFEGFQRKAVVVVPTEEEFKRRVDEREKEEGKDVPEKAVLEMKANFTMPEEGQLFDSLEFTELAKEEAQKVVDKYRKEAQALLPPPEKRFRDNRYGGRGRFDYRDNRRGGYGYGDRDRFGRGGYRGGYRDDRRGGRQRPYDRRGGYGGYGGPRGPPMRTGSSYGGGNRYDNRMQLQDRRSSGGSRDSMQSYGRSSQPRSSSYGGGYKRNQNWGNQGSWGHQGWNQGQWGSGSGQSNYGNWGYNQSSGSSSQGSYGGSGQWSGSGQNWGNQNYWSGNYSQGHGQQYSGQWYGSSYHK